MTIEEIRMEDLDVPAFIEDQCRSISAEVGQGTAVNAL